MLPISNDNIYQNFVERFLKKETGKNSWDYQTDEEKLELTYIIFMIPFIILLEWIGKFQLKSLELFIWLLKNIFIYGSFAIGVALSLDAIVLFLRELRNLF